MNIFGSRKPSDDELIERTRKQLDNPKGRWLLLVLAVGSAAVAVWLGPNIFLWIDTLKSSGPQWQWFLFGFSSGLTVAAFLMWLCLSSFYWFWLFFAPSLFARKDRLLVRYYERVHHGRDA
jgi:hypothetical protein